MVLVNTTIRTFHADRYRPDINKLDFYLPRVTILGGNNCGKTRREGFERMNMLMGVNSTHYYTERLYFKL